MLSEAISIFEPHCHTILHINGHFCQVNLDSNLSCSFDGLCLLLEMIRAPNLVRGSVVERSGFFRGPKFDDMLCIFRLEPRPLVNLFGEAHPREKDQRFKITFSLLSYCFYFLDHYAASVFEKYRSHFRLNSGVINSRTCHA